MDIKQKVRIKRRETNIDISSNQFFLESVDYLFQFIQIKITMLNDLKLKESSKKLFIIEMSSSIEKTFMINQLIQI